MPISKYENTCKYNIDKLDKVVYLINENALKNIHIDNGEAYIDGISQEPLTLSVYNIQLKDSDELDERYKFTHTLTFSMNGYANYKDFEGRYYAIVKTVDGEYWLVNPMFPCKVTYTYTLDSTDSRTDFTLATISNHPTLRIHGMEESVPYECKYRYCTFNSLRLNETQYSLLSGNDIIFTNDGFKDIQYNNNSAVMTETFDGTNIQHKVSFNIRFDDYKSSWHYNLLEFVQNKYAAIIDTTCGMYVLTGFHFGLQPSFTVEANDNMTMNNIQIDLVDTHDNGTFIGYSSAITISKDESSQWIYTDEFNGFECVGNNLARYLLKQEIDVLENPTGNYKVLAGYESQFSFLNIVGTFNETVTFNSNACSDNCKIQTTLPMEFIFNDKSCKIYTINSDSDWSITSSANHITVSPTSGEAGQTYDVTICNTQTPTSSASLSYINLSYCNRTKTYNVKVIEGDSCLPAGSIFDISANGQYVIIPIICCVKSATDSSGVITNANIQNSYIKVYVPQNNTGSNRQFILSLVYCDDDEGMVIINQSAGFERWVKESSGCSGNQLCDIERKFTGTTIDNINTRTDETRTTNCVDSPMCSGVMKRWSDSSGTTCSNGKRYIIQIEETSTDSGTTWTPTGNERMGDEIPDPSGDCATGITYEYRWAETSATTCAGITKYYLYKKQRRRQNFGGEWEDVVPTVTSIDGEGTMTPRVAEAQSPDCGYVPPITPIYKWVVMDINNYWVCASCSDSTDQQSKIEYRIGSGTVQNTYCDSNTILSASDYSNSDISYAKVGSCITGIGEGCFSGRTNLSEILLPSTVTSIGNRAFSGCTGLVDFTLPMTTTSIGAWVFDNCIQLNKLLLPNSLTSIGDGAFLGCKNLNTINIPNSVTVIPYMCFYDCDGLTDIYLHGNITRIGSNAFENCSGLVNLTCYASTPPEIGTNVFQGTSNNFKIYVPQSSLIQYKAMWNQYSNNIYSIGE